MKYKVIIGAAVTLIALGCADKPSLPTVTDASPSRAPGTITEGTWEIGQGADQVAPGVYKVDFRGTHCYWARLRNATGSDSIIANNLVAAPGPIVLEILTTDKYVQTNSCGTWVKSSS